MAKVLALQLAVAACTLLLGGFCEVRRNAIIQKRNDEFLKEIKESTEELHKEMRAKLYETK